MQKHFLFFSLFFIVFLSWSPATLAKKKYRYIKREHGVRFQWDNPINFDSQGQITSSVNIEGAYTYNWRGMLEAGPYIKIDLSIMPFQLAEFDGGVLLEYNIIKNRGKRKLIPAVGVSVGVNKQDRVFSLSGGIHGALKFFVAKRTPFTIMLGYRMLTPMDGNQLFKFLSHRPYTSMGFSYYFDFY